MYKKRTILKIFIFFLLNFFIFNFEANWYKKEFLDNSLKLKAELKDKKVYLDWSAFKNEKNFKYYKIMKSTSNEYKDFSENNYIKFSTNINFTKWLDISKNYQKTYYKICAITKEETKYCSRVVKVEKTPPTIELQLHVERKIMLETFVDNFIIKMENNNYSKEKKLKNIDKLISKLKIKKLKKPKYKLIINYLIINLQNKKTNIK